MPIKIQDHQFDTIKSLLQRQDEALEKLEVLDAQVESAINELILGRQSEASGEQSAAA